MMKGQVLYRDIWDHKPPMVFLINLCALKYGDGTFNSIRTAERIFAIVGGILFFLMVSAVFRSKLLAFVATLFFILHMYHPLILTRGNLPTEYGAIFLIGGACAAFASRRLKGSLSAAMSFVCGFVLSLATLTKEPFILSAIPWFLYLTWPRKGRWKQTFTRAGLFIAGALVPVMVFAVYLLANSAMSDYLKTTSYSFAYAGGTGSFDLLHSAKAAYTGIAKVMVITQIAAGLGLISLFSRSFVRKFYYLPIAIFGSLFFSFIATSIGRYFPHYYMQLVPSYVLMAACGPAFVIELLHRVKVRWPVVLLAVLLLCGVVFVDRIKIKHFVQSLAMPSQRWEGDGLTRFVLSYSRRTDTIWAPSVPFVSMYADTARLSPTRWLVMQEHYFIDTPDSTGEEKLALLKEQLQSRPPRLIVITPSSQPLFNSYGLSEWVRANYKMGFESKAEKDTPEAELDVEVWVYAK